MIGKLIISLIVCTVYVRSAPTNHQPFENAAAARILRYENEPADTGYRFEYETSDGQTRREEGYIKQLEDGSKILAVYGSYSYIGPDNVAYYVEYISDENGFRPVGNHLPGRNNQLGGTH